MYGWGHSRHSANKSHHVHPRFYSLSVIAGGSVAKETEMPSRRLASPLARRAT